jgi:frataxin
MLSNADPTQEYHRAADEALENILTVLESTDSIEKIEESDVVFASGVLTLSLGDKGTWVLNKQPPNLQIWTSSPLAGPRRYDYDGEGGIWKCVREKTDLNRDLETELRGVLGDESINLSGERV